MAKYKYYVVWEGRARGIFDSWEECKEQVDNFKGAKYKSFDSLEAATEAFRNAPDDYFDVIRKIGEHSRDKLSAPILPPSVIADSLSVDAACSGNPGKMEYRGVDTKIGNRTVSCRPFGARYKQHRRVPRPRSWVGLLATARLRYTHLFRQP